MTPSDWIIVGGVSIVGGICGIWGGLFGHAIVFRIFHELVESDLRRTFEMTSRNEWKTMFKNIGSKCLFSEITQNCFLFRKMLILLYQFYFVKNPW